MAIIFSRGHKDSIGSTESISAHKRTRCTPGALFELFLQRGRQVLCHPQRFHGNINRGDARRFDAIGAKVGDSLLHGNLIGILTEKVGLQEKERTQDKM
jgi:hypothetical protein